MSETLKANSIKQKVVEMILRLPDDCTMQDIQYHLLIRTKIYEAIKDIKEGRVYEQQAVERMSAEWSSLSDDNRLE